MKLISLLIVCYLLSFSLLASETIHYFDLQHRPANEVIPLLQPLLQEQETISGDGFQLFIKTTPQREQEIKKLISAIDRRIKSFRVSVTHDEYTVLEENKLSASVRARTGSGQVKAGQYPSKKSSVTIHADTRYTEDKSDKTQFVQVQEGKPAFISREKLRILPVHSYVQRPNGIFLIENDLSSASEDGFYVIARSADSETVNVSIQTASSNQQTSQRYETDQTYIETDLRIALGKWIEIGGHTETHSEKSKGILYRTKKNRDRYKKIFLKVELDH